MSRVSLSLPLQPEAAKPKAGGGGAAGNKKGANIRAAETKQDAGPVDMGKSASDLLAEYYAKEPPEGDRHDFWSTCCHFHAFIFYNT